MVVLGRSAVSYERGSPAFIMNTGAGADLHPLHGGDGAGARHGLHLPLLEASSLLLSSLELSDTQVYEP